MSDGHGPRRIVSLVPNLSEVLWWWHLADRVVGVTDWCVAPPRAFDHARRVRGTKNPDVAAIVELAPDLVVASEEENREIDVRRLQEAGVAVHVTEVRTVEDAGHALVELAEVLGVASAGVELHRAIANALDQLVAPRRRLLTACPIWRDGPSTTGPGGQDGSTGTRDGDRDELWWLAGRNTFVGDLLGRCGFDVLPDDPDARYPRVALSEVAEHDPDVVLLPDEPYAFGPDDAAVFADWRARARLIDGTSLSWWGPRTPTALGELSRLARQLASPRRRARRA